MESNILLFLGRFHPLIVHLPIGFLILALFFQMVEYIARKEYSILEHAIRYALLLGAITAFLAVISGWVLAGNSRYGSATLNWHRWGGVAVMVFAFIAWMLQSGMIRIQSRYYNWNIVLLAFALMATGHWGGSLTHGDDYLLEHAPLFIKNLIGPNSDTIVMKPLPENPDSVVVYVNLIQPVLETNCYGCHNSDQKSGGLDMTSKEPLMEGGDEGKTIVRSNALESGLFKRVTLPVDHTKFMPPRGDPLSYSEIRILEWWINQGASFEASLSSLEVPEDLSALLLEKYKLDLRPRPFYETTKIVPVSPEVIENIKENGFQINVLSEGNYYLRVSIDGEGEANDFKSLIPAKDQIVILDLSGAGVTDQALEWVGKLHNLYSLDLRNTRISDKGLAYLESLNRLSILNLYGTDITDLGLNSIRSLSGLKKIYVWQTGVTETFADQWMKERPGMQIVTGE